MANLMSGSSMLRNWMPLLKPVSLNWSFNSKSAGLPPRQMRKVFWTGCLSVAVCPTMAPFSTRQKWGRLDPLPREHGRDARLENAGFLSGDRFDALAEVRFVVEIDGRDHGEIGNHHVGSIETSAESHFEHHHVHALFFEYRERHGGDGLEVSGVHVDGAFGHQLFHAGVHAFEGGSEALDGHGRPIDADTLGGFGEMRRGEKAGAPAGRPQSRFQHGADGSLAVGAGDRKSTRL